MMTNDKDITPKELDELIEKAQDDTREPVLSYEWKDDK